MNHITENIILFLILGLATFPWLGFFGPEWTYWALIAQIAGSM